MSFGQRSQSLTLIPLDPEIERTLHKLNKLKRGKDVILAKPSHMAKEPKPVKDYDVPSVVASPSSIRHRTIDANNFEIRLAIISMIHQSSIFCGLPQEDPNSHISNFLELCDTFKCNGATNDVVHLRIFPFSLKEKAKSWLNCQPPNSISTWDDLAKKFLAKFVPPAKTAKLKNDMEPFYEA